MQKERKSINGVRSNLLSSKIHVISDKLWKVAVFGPDNYKSALISHYLRTKDRKLKKHAIEFAADLLDGYYEEEITSFVAEDALQYMVLLRFLWVKV